MGSPFSGVNDLFNNEALSAQRHQPVRLDVLCAKAQYDLKHSRLVRVTLQIHPDRLQVRPYVVQDFEAGADRGFFTSASASRICANNIVDTAGNP